MQKKKIKRIIALILCVTLILGIDNFICFKSVFGFINHKITILGSTVVETVEETKKMIHSDGQIGNMIINNNIDIEDTESNSTEIIDGKGFDYTNETVESELFVPKKEVSLPKSIDNSAIYKSIFLENANNDSVAYASARAVSGQLSKIYENGGTVEIGGTYEIHSTEDWNKLFEISETNTLEGMEFIIYQRLGKYDDWDISGKKIGNEQFPFSGTIYPFFASTKIITDTVIFDYLSSKAQIGINKKPFNIQYDKGVKVQAGLANNLVLEAVNNKCEVNIGRLDATGNSNYFVEIKEGVISSSTYAGGLFGKVYIKDTLTPEQLEGKVESIYKLNIFGNNEKQDIINLSGITDDKIIGAVAGGMIGEIDGPIDVTVNGLPLELVKISSTNANSNAAGNLFGNAINGVNIVFNNTSKIILDADIEGAVYSGGLIGYLGESKLTCKNGIVQNKNISGAKYAGGVVGYAYNSTCIVSDYTQNNNTSIKQRNAGTTGLYLSAGCVIGKYLNDSTTRNDTIELSYIKSQNKDVAKMEKVYLQSNETNYNAIGGLAGIITAGNASVYIHDINTDTVSKGENTLNVNMVYSLDNISGNTGSDYLYKGGLVGCLSGEDITIDNIVFNYKFINSNEGRNSNSISAYYVGNIAARVGYCDNKNIESKLIVKNIEVLDNYIFNVKGYHGGLFGIVNQSVIALQEKIDLRAKDGYSGVPYVAFYNDTRTNKTGDIRLLASKFNRGFIAGNSDNTLIYRDIGCIYKKPITYDETTGEINEFNANSFKNAGNTYTYGYCIDDIGTYGSVFINQKDDSIESRKVLDITKNVNDIVQGKITKEGEYYIIDSIADALRLAVTGSVTRTVNKVVYSKVGSNCFINEGDSELTYSEIFGLKYKITTDLDLGNAGIHGFMKNSDDVYGNYYFSGTFEGMLNSEGNSPKITIDFIARQRYAGLFPSVKDAKFINLDINGNIFYTHSKQYSAAAGSLGAYATGEIYIDNVDIYTHIKDSLNHNSIWDNSHIFCYGGMFGIYVSNGSNYICKNSNISPKFTNIRVDAYNGGMIGFVQISSKNILNNMSITGCTLGTNIKTNETYLVNNGGGYNTNARIGGLICLVSSKVYNVNEPHANNEYPAATSDQTNGYINISNLNVVKSEIDLTTTYTTNEHNIKVTGGLLGFAWTSVDVVIDGLSVTECSMKTKGYVGGLITYAAGKFDLYNISINSLIMEHINNYSVYPTYDMSGFLIGNGQRAFVNIKNYTISKEEGKVQYINFTNFDEIVGINITRKKNSNNVMDMQTCNIDIDSSYIKGGIVNIIDASYKNYDNSEGALYKSYVNQVVKETNKNTRYYYNLFTDNDDGKWNITVSEDKKSITASINTPEQWMTYHVATYATADEKTYLRRYFNKYIFNDKGENVNVTTINNILINSNLNMKGYSLYPTSISNVKIEGNGNTITLYGEAIANLEKKLNEDGKNLVNRTNENTSITDDLTKEEKDKCTQHYMMHASLFNSVRTNTEIQNLIITGTAANVGADSGALISGGVYGTGIKISNITTNNLQIGNYNDTKCGLLVSHIGTDGNRNDVATHVTFDKIKTDKTSYIKPEFVAAALVGYVGSDDAINTVVLFNNMQIDYNNANTRLFKYASFVYDYKYINDSDDNRCYMMYSFKKTDCNDNVTYGDEIKAGVHYSDVDRVKTDEKDLLNIAIEKAKNNEFIPYVFTERNIYVNPRNGNITEGCGTYEDPYKITNAKQFLTLYLYLSGKTDYETMFKGSGNEGVWKVVPVGGVKGSESECCNKGSGGTHVAVAFPSTVDEKNEGLFPTRDELRTAYYQICNDISLGAEDDMNDKYIAGEFCGLGSSEYPFAGVIIGTKEGSDTDNRYTISFPIQAKRNYIKDDGTTGQSQISQTTMGLIQFMAGGVVKDINITSDNPDGYYNISYAGGGAAAIIVGGDNIIDNVKITLNFNIDNSEYVDEEGNGGIEGLGGLVGIVKDGSLILRNISPDYVVSGSTFENYSTEVAQTSVITNNIFTKMTNLFSAYTELKSESDTPPKEVEESVEEDINGISRYTGEYDGYVGMLVGRVYDGYIIYEGYKTTGAQPKVLTRNELKLSDRYISDMNIDENGITKVTTHGYPVVNGFHIINANVFDTASSSGRFKFTKTDENNYKVLIKNEDQLEMLELALNSDAFSVYYCEGNDHETAYGYKDRCRRATYEDVGTTNAINSKDRNFAVRYDDKKEYDIGYLYPYICYKYMDYTSLTADGEKDISDPSYIDSNYEGYKTTISEVTRTEKVGNSNVTRINYISNINKTIPEVANYTTVYELEKELKDDGSGNVLSTSKVYDLSTYDMSFRGIGAVYTKKYSDFRASFNGNGNIITFCIDRTYDDTIMYSGMFNELVYNQKVIAMNTSDKQLEITNFTIKNSIVHNPNKFSEIDFNNNTNNVCYNYIKSKGINTCATGSLAGIMMGAWRIENITLARDVDITDKKITSDISGYKSVGGFVGRINNTVSYNGDPSVEWMNSSFSNSNEIDFINCNIKGNSVKIKVEELGSKYARLNYAQYRYTYAGGLVGGIGTNYLVDSVNYTHVYGSVDFTGCGIDQLGITAYNKGSIGGFVGVVGIRHNANTWYSSQRASIGTITIDGRYSDELGNSRTSSVVSNVEIVSSSVEDDYSSGGILGRVESPKKTNYPGGLIDIRNYSIDNVSIYNTRSVSKTRPGYNDAYEGDGGIVGYLRADTLNLKNISVKNSKIGFQNSGKDTGGFIGYIRPTGNRKERNDYRSYNITNVVNIDEGEVYNTEVKSGNGATGGFIGLSHIKEINIGNESIDKLNIVSQSVVKTYSNSSLVGSGGIIGFLLSNGYESDLSEGFVVHIDNTDVKDSSISGGAYGSGGILGYAKTEWGLRTYLTINNVNVYTSIKSTSPMEITNVNCAGGIIGMAGSTGNIGSEYNYTQIMLTGKIGVGTSYNSGVLSDSNLTGINVKGRYSGGIAGYSDSRYSEVYSAEICVANNRIYSYIDNNNNSNNVNTYSGGLFGYRVNNSDTDHTYNKVTIKNNVIFTGASNNTSRERKYGTVGCGGLYGYIYIRENMNTYMPDVILENNSIGYYNVLSNDKKNSWNQVKLEDDTVQLYDAAPNEISKYISGIKWDEIKTLNETTVGNYAVAFGQFIGVLDAKDLTSQIYILDPQVKIDNTVGSIPVIDVGSNTRSDTVDQSTMTYGEGYPYEYRKYCHIVYMDNPTIEYTDISTKYNVFDENNEVIETRKPLTIDSSLLINNEKEYAFGNLETEIEKYNNLNRESDDTSLKNYNFILSKRLNMYMTYNNEKYSLCTGDKSYHKLAYDTYDKNNVKESVRNGVQVLVIDGLDPQYVGDYVAAIITNGGGIVSESVVNDLKEKDNNTMNDFWSISCQNAYIDTDGSIKPVDINDPIFSSHKGSSIMNTSSTEKNRIKLADLLYDEILNVESEGEQKEIHTITLLGYTYTCPNALGKGYERTETIYIPIFVKEKVTMDSYIRILSNEEYSLDYASKKGFKEEVNITHGSTYTIYTEFIYDQIRMKESFKGDVVKKSVFFNDSTLAIVAGTKLTLIDHATGKEYYYTAVEDEIDNKIPFEEFSYVDDDGNKVFYQEKAIGDIPLTKSYKSIGYQIDGKEEPGEHSYKDVGIERFFVVVEPSVADYDVMVNLNIKSEAFNGKKSVDEFFNKNVKGDADGIRIRFMPGPILEFGGVNENGKGTDGVTFIEGAISHDNEQQIDIDANIKVYLEDEHAPYWVHKESSNTIDTTNSKKYLEVGVTLLDENNEVVPWPQGTNISFNGGPKQPLKNSLVVYMYKDFNKVFPMDNIKRDLNGTCYYYNINEDVNNKEMQWIYYEEDIGWYYNVLTEEENRFGWDRVNLSDLSEIKEEFIELSNQCNVKLDFSVADIEEYNGKTYKVMMKLYRSDDPLYPNEGNTKDSGENTKRQFMTPVEGETKRELAAAVMVDDLLDLGINLYTRKKEVYEISFTNKLDFSGQIHKSRIDEDVDLCAAREYMVTYRLYKKVKSPEGSATPEFGVTYNTNIGNTIYRNDYQYELIDWKDAPFKLYDSNNPDTPLGVTQVTVNDNETQNVIVTTKEFTVDEIKEGTNNIPYLREWETTLKIDTTDMDNVDLTNYMLTATYVPYDKYASDADIPVNDQNQTLYDYFVFTIAKLKTDM